MFKPKYDSGTFITDYSATSHVVTTEENITNLCNAETQFTVGDSGTLTGKNLAIGMNTRNVTDNSIMRHDLILQYQAYTQIYLE